MKEILTYPVGIYLLKVNNGNNMWEICSNLTINTLERRHLQISYFLTFNTSMPSGQIFLMKRYLEINESDVGINLDEI